MKITQRKETRMILCHQWGRRDFNNGVPFAVPPFLKDDDERVAYEAGWKCEQRRADRRERMKESKCTENDTI